MTWHLRIGIALLAVLLSGAQAAAQRFGGRPSFGSNMSSRPSFGGTQFHTFSGQTGSSHPGSRPVFQLAPGGGGVSTFPTQPQAPRLAPGFGGINNNLSNQTTLRPTYGAAPGGGGVANNPFAAPGGGGVVSMPEAAPGGGGVANNPFSTNVSSGDPLRSAPGGGGVANNPWANSVATGPTYQYATGGGSAATNPWNPNPYVQTSTQTSATATSASYEFNTRYLKLSNKTGEKLKVYLRYQTWSDLNRWEWFPEGANAVVYTLPAGVTATVTHQRWRVHAYSVRIWAETVSGKKSYLRFRDQDLVLVRETDSRGRHVYQSAQMGTTTYTFK